MPNREDLVAGLTGIAKAVVSRLPGVAEIVAAWDAVEYNRYRRELDTFLEALNNALINLDARLDPAWLRTDEGEVFVRKILGCAIDAQLADKKEMFANALINGYSINAGTQLEKLKFVDMLRQLSRASLMILAQIDPLFRPQVRGAGRTPDPTAPYPLVDPLDLAERFSQRYDPYFVEACVRELQNQGLFSTVGEWCRSPDGTSHPHGGFQNALTYTDFACRFVDFITLDPIRSASR